MSSDKKQGNEKGEKRIERVQKIVWIFLISMIVLCFFFFLSANLFLS